MYETLLSIKGILVIDKAKNLRKMGVHVIFWHMLVFRR